MGWFNENRSSRVGDQFGDLFGTSGQSPQYESDRFTRNSFQTPRISASDYNTGPKDDSGLDDYMRAGMTEADAREILLTNANTLTKWKALQGRVGQTLVPFRTISSNQFEQGMTRWKKYPAIYAGAVVLGAVAGKNIKDKEALALAAAFTGPYAGPFLAGAAITQGGKALEGISPIPEWGIIKTMGSFLMSLPGGWYLTTLVR